MKWRDQSGAAMVTVSFLLFLLLGVAAVALDLSAGWNERRQDQTAADLAAVAGALSFGDSDAIVKQVMLTARANLDTAYADTDWVALWTGCTDPDRPGGFTPITHTTLGILDCISLNPSFIRVRLPDQLIDTSFGRILGINVLKTHADSVVTLLGVGGGGGFPFAVRGNAAAGEICLDTSTGSKIVPPCDGSESGSFGNIAPPLFGDDSLRTAPDCSGQTSANNNVPETIAMGVDHRLWEMSQAGWNAGMLDPDRSQDMAKIRVDPFTNLDECTLVGSTPAAAADGNPINGVYVDTGNSVKSDITEGLMTGTAFPDGGDARLTRVDAANTREVDGYKLDNIPLWEHLFDPDIGDPGHEGDCDYSTYSILTISQKNDRIRSCVENWTSSGAQIFDDSILDSARLGTAPRLWFNVLGSGLSYSPIQSFEVVYIHAIFFDDKDDTVFYPGDGNTPINMTNWKEIEQVTAFLLIDEMVSAFVHEQLGNLADGLFQPTIYE